MKTLEELKEKRKKEGGFTLIELLIVIAIIAILASIAIPQYIKYQRKAKVSSYAEPIARGCLMDLVSQCIESGSVNASAAQNCVNNATTPGGTVKQVATPTTGTCSDGALQNAKVEYEINGVNDYKAQCITDNSGNIKCSVVNK